MNKKANARMMLEQGMLQFIAAGKEITKLPAQKMRGPRTQLKEKVIEIEVDHLPASLKLKHFGTR